MGSQHNRHRSEWEERAFDPSYPKGRIPLTSFFSFYHVREGNALGRFGNRLGEFFKTSFACVRI